MKTVLRFALRLGVLAAIAVIVIKLLDDKEQIATTVAPEPAPEPEPQPEPAVAWVEPDGAVCPTSHPIKAKVSSKVFRGPRHASYESSKPDRCYASEDAAQADGFREAKR